MKERKGQQAAKNSAKEQKAKKKLSEMNLLDDFLFGSVVTYMCVEVPEMEYEDGASTVFLYTGGTEGVTNEAVKQLLYYMEHTDCKNAVNNDLREIHRMIETVKRDPEMTIRYLRLMEELDRSRAEGKKYTLVSLVCKKMKKNKTIEEIAEDLEEEISVIEPIYTTAKSFAPEYDPDLVFERLNAVE